MKYFIIAGEASGDLHAANLIRELRNIDREAEIVAFGGEEMMNAGAKLLCNYHDIAYMGFIPVALHFRVILRAMKECKKQIVQMQPDVVILVDYPGFNLNIAHFVKTSTNIPVFYYISPKIWAWKEGRIKNIRRDVDELFSILPFEVDFFEKKHNYPIHYVGNPTVDEVERYKDEHKDSDVEGFLRSHSLKNQKILAVLAGSRKQEIKDNLEMMCEAAEPLTYNNYQLLIAGANGIDEAFYYDHIPLRMRHNGSIKILFGQTFDILSHADAALVTSGTATLETALFRVPEVVCYYIPVGKFIKFLSKLFLHVPYVSLVNLIAGREIVKELVADEMTTINMRHELLRITADEENRKKMLADYDEMAKILGASGAARHAAQQMVELLKK